MVKVPYRQVELDGCLGDLAVQAFVALAVIGFERQHGQHAAFDELLQHALQVLVIPRVPVRADVDEHDGRVPHAQFTIERRFIFGAVVEQGSVDPTVPQERAKRGTRPGGWTDTPE